MKSAFLSVLLVLPLFVFSGAAQAAADTDCLQTFYQTKDSNCLDTLVSYVPSFGNKPNPEFLGFFAEVFNTYPQQKARLLAQNVPSRTKIFFTEALYTAGLASESQKYADANGLTDLIGKMSLLGLVPVEQMKPSVKPSDNDALVGAYSATGNTEYLTRLLQNFSSANDDMVSNSIRLSMMQAKFGQTLAPPGREKRIMQAACEKYECKKDMHDMMRVMTLSSGFWALNSLSIKDAGIRKTLVDFFEKDSRLKRLLDAEETAFGNYMTTLKTSFAMKDDPNVNASLLIYENLGSGNAAQTALMGKR